MKADEQGEEGPPGMATAGNHTHTHTHITHTLNSKKKRRGKRVEAG